MWPSPNVVLGWVGHDCVWMLKCTETSPLIYIVKRLFTIPFRIFQSISVGKLLVFLDSKNYLTTDRLVLISFKRPCVVLVFRKKKRFFFQSVEMPDRLWLINNKMSIQCDSSTNSNVLLSSKIWSGSVLISRHNEYVNNVKVFALHMQWCLKGKTQNNNGKTQTTRQI